MANHPAPPLLLPDAQHDVLTTWSRSGRCPNARCFALASCCWPPKAFPPRVSPRGRLLGADRAPLRERFPLPVSLAWRRTLRGGEPGAVRRANHRPGAQRHLGPSSKGETHWSSRAVAERVGISAGTVLRSWHEHHIQPYAPAALRQARPELRPRSPM